MENTVSTEDRKNEELTKEISGRIHAIKINICRESPYLHKTLMDECLVWFDAPTKSIVFEFFKISGYEKFKRKQVLIKDKTERGLADIEQKLQVVFKVRDQQFRHKYIFKDLSDDERSSRILDDCKTISKFN